MKTLFVCENLISDESKAACVPVDTQTASVLYGEVFKYDLPVSSHSCYYGNRSLVHNRKNCSRSSNWILYDGYIHSLIRMCFFHSREVKE